MGIIALSDKEFKLISQLVYNKFGINLTEQKKTLVIERLQKTLRAGNFTSFKAYYEHILEDSSGQALLHLVDKISTNHTYFFREQEHYTFLKSVILPNLVEAQKYSKFKTIKIWSAGCSSGEEAYTIAMVVKEFLGFDFPNWEVGILATDISTSVLEKALLGVYGDNQLVYMPKEFKNRYFKNCNDGTWEISQDIKQMVLFRRLNLMNAEFPFKGRFHIIFCRNVMIYFDNITREALVERFHRYNESNGYLFIGHSESLTRDNPYYKYIKPAIYLKK